MTDVGAPRRTGAAVWTWVFLAWSAYGIVAVAQSALWWFAVGNRPPYWFNPVVYSFAIVWTFAALTPLVVAAARRIPVRRGKLVPALGAHTAGALTVAVIGAGVTALVAHVLPGASRPPFLIALVDRFDVSVFYYIGTVAVTLALDAARAARERQLASVELAAELSRAQLRSLRLQLQPHFLFNALNTISALVHRDAERADAMICSLGGLLRMTLEHGDAQEITLERELRGLQLYLEIEQERHQDWLSVRIDAAPDALNGLVPALLLQPLVENAIRHGIAPSQRPGCVTVSARRHADTLHLVVEDDGVGFASDNGNGVGLSATAERLRLLYGDAHGMRIEPLLPTGTRISLSLPYRAGEDEAGARSDEDITAGADLLTPAG